ncbi:hypothetical protein M8494_15650 [Serratia ureilytica]
MLFIAGKLPAPGHQLPADLARQVRRTGEQPVTPQAAAAAVGLVAENARGTAISIVYGGMTLAIALGIPFRYLSRQAPIGWREIFLFIALLGRLRCWACRWRCAPSRCRASIRLKSGSPRCGKAVLTTLPDHLFRRLLGTHRL